MATRKNTAPRRRRTRLDLIDLLGQFSDARALLECAYVVLEEGDPGNESVCLKVGLEMLRTACGDLDRAITDGAIPHA